MRVYDDLADLWRQRITAAIGEVARHFEAAASLYDEAGFDIPGLDGYRRRMALLHAMQTADAAVTEVFALGGKAPAGELHPPEAVRVDLVEITIFQNRALDFGDTIDLSQETAAIEAARRLAGSFPRMVAEQLGV